MKRTILMVIAAVLLCGLVTVALAQDQEYALKDYMPYTIGSKWTMSTTNRQGATTITLEIEKPKEGQPGVQISTKAADGTLQRGSLESITDDSYTIYGTVRVPRGGGDPTVTLYNPAAVFPGKMKAGGHAEAATKVSMQGQDVDVTMKIDLVAVESVKVPKGTFDNCLKLVFTSTTPRGDMKRTAWYAKGIGVVKTEQTGMGQNATPRTAELVDYTLAQ